MSANTSDTDRCVSRGPVGRVQCPSRQAGSGGATGLDMDMEMDMDRPQRKLI